MNQEVTLLAAFAAGFLSFVSPCVLPLIPGYISFVSGVSVEEMRGDAAPATSRMQVFLTSLAFVIGFSIVFVALGASATAIGKFMFAKLPLLSKIAGAILIIFGLHTMGVFRIAFLEAEKRVHAQRKPAGPLGAMLVGVAFAFGWTPCIGPILGGILAIAGSKNSVAEGVTLLAVYSLGLGIPFLLTSLAINQFFGAAKRIRRYYHAIELVSGRAAPRHRRADHQRPTDDHPPLPPAAITTVSIDPRASPLRIPSTRSRSPLRAWLRSRGSLAALAPLLSPRFTLGLPLAHCGSFAVPIPDSDRSRFGLQSEPRPRRHGRNHRIEAVLLGNHLQRRIAAGIDRGRISLAVPQEGGAPSAWRPAVAAWRCVLRAVVRNRVNIRARRPATVPPRRDARRSRQVQRRPPVIGVRVDGMVAHFRAGRRDVPSPRPRRRRSGRRPR
jgi:cytochrome c-type biogenesis protein